MHLLSWARHDYYHINIGNSQQHWSDHLDVNPVIQISLAHHIWYDAVTDQVD